MDVPGRTAPVASAAVPVIVPPVCPNALTAETSKQRAINRKTFFIVVVSSFTRPRTLAAHPLTDRWTHPSHALCVGGNLLPKIHGRTLLPTIHGRQQNSSVQQQ